MSTTTHQTPADKASLMQRLAQLPRERRADLVRQLAQHAKPPISTIPKLARRDTAPLSFAQERLWILDQLLADGSAYNVSFALRLQGELQVDALRQSFDLLVARHEVLRTTFASRDGEVRQIVQPAGPWDLPLHDISALAAEQRGDEVRRRVDEESRRVFDLTSDAMLRTSLLRLAEREHVLLITVHHIAADDWSVGVLVGEIAAAYSAQCQGQTATLPDLPLQYADFAVWQRKRLRGPLLEQELAFWREQLAAAPVLSLPTDFARPSLPSQQGSRVRLVIDAETSRGLRDLSRREGVTMFTLLLAGYQLLLHRYSHDQDISVGTVVANRDRAELQSLVGFLVNTLVFRVKLNPDHRFVGFLADVKQVVQQALAHQEIPFERLVKELELPQDLSVSPLFQVAFTMQQASLKELELPGLTVAPLETETGTSKFDLTLVMAEANDDLAGILEYNSDVFSETTVRRMADHYVQLLKAIVAEPEACLAEIEFLAPGERRQLLVDWNRTEEQIPEDKCIPDIFEAWVERTPTSTAVVFDQNQLNYRELNAQVNQLAHYLRSRGVAPEARVGVFLERSLETVVTMLAVLKAGGVYVPLDPAYPKSRIEFMLQDSAARALVTQSSLRDRLPPTAALILYLDSEREAIAGQPVENPRPLTVPAATAYVIYTSGSTGRPKGVLGTHRGLVNLQQTQGSLFGVTAADRVLQFASPSFDASISEIIVTLCSGAGLYMTAEKTLASADDLAHFIRDKQLTMTTLPPSMLELLPTAVPLQTVISAGEPCTADIVARWGDRKLINAYGPSETTVCATLTTCDPNSAERPSIGGPIGNTQVYVLDSQLRPVPVGVYGELCISGVGLSPGYQGRAALTAERFVPNPFADVPGSRMYRSGDVARWRADGTLEFQGRIDNQVKIRGHRIEPGEIETALRSHPAIGDVAVQGMAIDPVAPDRQQLVAYVVPTAKQKALESRIEIWPSVAEYFVYDDVLYFAMANDKLRNEHYRSAIADAVAGQIVLEIGPGAEAVLTQMCVEAGARHVYAVEYLEESFHKAQRRIDQLGMSDRVTLVHGDACTVQLPEKADVCVSEIVGAIGGSEGAAYITNRVRRLLTDSAQMIPARSVTKVAAVHMPDSFMAQPAFSEAGAAYAEKIFAQVGRRFDLRICPRGASRDDLISDIALFEDLDFRNEIPLESSHEFQMTIDRDTRLDGLLVWLTLNTTPDRCLDILENEHCWLPVFLPAFELGIDVSRGTRVQGHVHRTLCENGRNPDYCVVGEVVFADGRRREFCHTASQFGQGYRETPFYQRLFDASPARNADAASLSQSQLRTYLETRLPQHMVPSRFEILERLPRLPNGKVNRKALPVPSDQRPQLEVSYVPPRSELEKTLAELFGEVLQLKQVGVHDNFFDLGGHSLAMVQVQQRLGEVLEAAPSMVELFQHPTIEALAAYLSGHQAEQVSQQSQARSDARQARQASRREQQTRRRQLRSPQSPSSP